MHSPTSSQRADENCARLAPPVLQEQPDDFGLVWLAASPAAKASPWAPASRALAASPPVAVSAPRTGRPS